MASAQHRVQQYLEKHKISALFEDLMAKIINAQPDEPLLYLNTVLERKLNRKKMSGVSKSTTVLDTHSKSAASVWASSDGALGKSGKKATSPGIKTKRPDWNPDKKISTTDDDLWNTRSTQSMSKTKSSVQISDVGNYGYINGGWAGPHRGTQSSDPLDDELLEVKTRKVRQENAQTSNFSSKKSGMKNDAQRHKQDLEKYLTSRDQQQEDSGIEDSKSPDDIYDDAVDVLENSDDLKAEGVKNPKARGVVLARRSSQKNTINREPTPVVKVSLCARCARVIAGSDPLQSGTANGSLPSVETVRPLSSRSSANDLTDDEFESVSQVTGPRQPVWTDPKEESQSVSHLFKGDPGVRESVSSLPARPTSSRTVDQDTARSKVISFDDDRDVENIDTLGSRGQWNIPDDTDASDIEWERDQDSATLIDPMSSKGKTS